MEIGAFLLAIAHRFVDHSLIFSREMNYAGCCLDTMSMGQLIDVIPFLTNINFNFNVNLQVFSEHGLGAVVLTMEPSRYEHCEGNERNDDLRQLLEAGPGLLTRQTMLQTPFVWIKVRPPLLLHSRSWIDRIRGRRQRPNCVAELFRPRFSAECHRWLNEPLSAPYQRLVARKLTTHLTIPFC